MANRRSKPGKIHLRIVEVMKRHPEGVTGGQIRQELEREGLGPGEHTHLDRRKRDLKRWFLIDKVTDRDETGRKVVVYKYRGERKEAADQGAIGIRLRAEVIHAAHGRCQMCGRTIEQHGITLVVDHKIPRDWGGSNDRENLWAICEECNAGKKSYFSSLNVDADLMRQVTGHKSVHVRIGELLKAVGKDRRTPSYLLEIVADQDDWHKRLRELRYPVIGWNIETRRYKAASGKVQVDYILRRYQAWPDDPAGVIRRYEQERERRNKGGLD